MRLETGATRTLRFGLVAIAALAFSIGLALGHISPARAQDDDAAAQSQEAADAAQQAHDAADAAQQALDAATEQRDQLEGAGASQDDIDAANQAIAAFTDFIYRYPQSDKIGVAEKYRAELKLEQARGLFHIGEFYEKNHYYKSALIYYNDVIEQNPESGWATQAKLKVAALVPRAAEKTATP